jgi:RND family efflux transporter MFP subunit
MSHPAAGGKPQPALAAGSQTTASGGSTARVTAEEVPITIEVMGTVQSRTPIEASSRVSATVAQVRVRAGDAVEQGELLVALDSADLAARRAQAEAALAAADAEVGRAASDDQRYRALVKRGSVTIKEFESAETAYRMATARQREAAAEVAAARAALRYTRIESPVKGLVAERLVEPGDLALPGKPLIRLYDAGVLRVEIQVPEQSAKLVRVGTALRVRIDATGEDIATNVNEVAPIADPASRSFIVRAPLPTGRGLRPGMFARASLAAGAERVLTVPREAIESLGQLDTARVVSGDGTVQMRQVALGRARGARVEVLAGLREGEQVLLKRREARGK